MISLENSDGCTSYQQLKSQKVPIYYKTSLVIISYANARVGLLETLVFEASTYEYYVPLLHRDESILALSSSTSFLVSYCIFEHHYWLLSLIRILLPI